MCSVRTHAVVFTRIDRAARVDILLARGASESGAAQTLKSINQVIARAEVAAAWHTFRVVGIRIPDRQRAFVDVDVAGLAFVAWSALAAVRVHAVGARAAIRTRHRSALVDVGGTGLAAVARRTLTAEGIHAVGARATVRAWPRGALVDVGGTGVVGVADRALAAEGGNQVGARAAMFTRRVAALVDLSAVRASVSSRTVIACKGVQHAHGLPGVRAGGIANFNNTLSLEIELGLPCLASWDRELSNQRVRATEWSKVDFVRRIPPVAWRGRATWVHPEKCPPHDVIR